MREPLNGQRDPIFNVEFQSPQGIYSQFQGPDNNFSDNGNPEGCVEIFRYTPHLANFRGFSIHQILFLLGNKIGPVGATAFADALKINTTVQSIRFDGIN